MILLHFCIDFTYADMHMLCHMYIFSCASQFRIMIRKTFYTTSPSHVHTFRMLYEYVSPVENFYICWCLFVRGTVMCWVFWRHCHCCQRASAMPALSVWLARLGHGAENVRGSDHSSIFFARTERIHVTCGLRPPRTQLFDMCVVRCMFQADNNTLANSRHTVVSLTRWSGIGLWERFTHGRLENVRVCTRVRKGNSSGCRVRAFYVQLGNNRIIVCGRHRRCRKPCCRFSLMLDYVYCIPVCFFLCVRAARDLRIKTQNSVFSWAVPKQSVSLEWVMALLCEWFESTQNEQWVISWFSFATFVKVYVHSWSVPLAAFEVEGGWFLKSSA